MNFKFYRSEFLRHLRSALVSLYDPSALLKNPLVDLLELKTHRDSVAPLQNVLIDAIEDLRHEVKVPKETKSWRTYQVLRRRYVEQLTQRRVAHDLGLSVRQLQREERYAREVLANYLWSSYRLENKLALFHTSASTRRVQSEGTMVPTREEELAWLDNTTLPQIVDISPVIEEVLETLRPLIHASDVTVNYHSRKLPVFVRTRISLCKQALINVINAAITHAGRGKVEITIKNSTPGSVIQVRIHAAAAVGQLAESEDGLAQEENLVMARKLVQLCKGSLALELADDFEAIIFLPSGEQVVVLVIDDNADTRQLFKRFLNGSRYLFAGAADCQEGLRLAQLIKPQVILLDVMMPDHDGWTFLSQLREHPLTRHIPVIVCTILTQEELAKLLGAAGYIRKPINRSDFILALDQQMNLATK